MFRLLLLLLPIICVIHLTAALSRCPRSNALNFAATHHHHHNPPSSSNGDNGSSGTRKKSVRDNTRPRDSTLSRRETVTCDSTYRYRLANGSCNNLNNPSWGATDQTYLRLLDPVYSDGKNLPRMKQTDGGDLPSPRTVSTNIHTFDFNRFHPVGSVYLMEWGQFLAHDITGTALDIEDLPADGACCSDGLVTGTDLHSDVLSGGPCFPIIIGEGDRYFTEVTDRCMEFIRSYPVTDSNEVRQQKSELSAYIDGTNVYGLNDDAMDALRTKSGGKLAVKNDDFLTESTANFCLKTDANDYCFASGDNRVNAYPGLGALHTVFHRYHNYVADQLATHHTDYNDETLFQEARKIVIAVLQRITYNEYLPLILGTDAMTTYGLNGAWSYDDSCDATLYNVFSTAAFRFGHSMVPNSLFINGSDHDSVNLYLRPYHVLNNLDSLLEGMAAKSAEKADRWYSEGITDHLFEMSSKDGYDIASLNIQRGRDHGLPPYNKWREYCSLSNYTSFSEMGSPRAYRSAYASVDDVDLYSGALSERSQGSTVGDTYKCLLGKQFQRLRNCDRFWWETTDTNIGFPDNCARNQIQKTRLSHIICLTTGVKEIQNSVMRVPVENTDNAAKSCSDLLANGADYRLF